MPGGERVFCFHLCMYVDCVPGGAVRRGIQLLGTGFIEGCKLPCGLTPTCISRRPDALIWPLPASAHTKALTHRHTKKNNITFTVKVGLRVIILLNTILCFKPLYSEHMLDL